MSGNFNPNDQNNELVARFETVLESVTDEEASNYYQMLVACDALLKETIEYLVNGTRPPPRKSTLGSYEYGALPFWFKNPDKIPGSSHIPESASQFCWLAQTLGISSDSP